MERFYAGTLGLTRMSAEYPRHVFFKVSDQSVLLIFNPVETAKGQDVPSHGAAGPQHVALAVETGQLDAWRTRLIEHGVEIEREIEWPNGARSVYFRDPAGHSVEIVTDNIWNRGD
jgi:catechol 2,3-dioxygenase-like lactoylglutathione lyase family enzyme